jgi:tetratricopeptide (TPR) repeat protein
VWYEVRSKALPAVLGLVALAYASSLGNGFCFDDHAIVVDNPLVREGRWGELLSADYWSPTGERTGLYRPLTIASFALNHRLFGAQAWSYHLANLILHLGATALLYLVAASWRAPRAALLAGLGYGLHPALSEAVVGVVGRAELLSCCLGLGGAWCWSRLADRHRPGLYLAGLALLAAAPLAKENGICFALGAAAWGFWHWRARVSLWCGALGAALFSLAVKGLALGQLQPVQIGFIDNPLAYVEAPVRALNSPALVVRYLRLLCFPWPLSADYSYNQLPVATGPDIEVLSALALALSLGWVIWRGVRSRPQWGLWVLAGGGALLLVANLFLAGGTLFAERLLYMPAVPFSLGLGWLGGRLEGRSFALLAWGWCLAAAPLTWSRSADWRDDLSLFSRAVQVTPSSARSHYGLGRALQQEGRIAEALAAYDRALAIHPRYAEAHFNRGAALLSQGDPGAAQQAYRRAAEIRPGFTKALYALAVLAQHLEGDSAAVPAYESLLSRDPGHLEGVRALSGILLRQGAGHRAEEVVRQALEARPGEAELQRLLAEIRVPRQERGAGIPRDPGIPRRP